MRFGKRSEFFSVQKKESGGRPQCSHLIATLKIEYFQMALNSSMTSRARDIALLTFYHYHFIIIIGLIAHKSRFPKMFGSRPKWFCRFSFPLRFRIQFLLVVPLPPEFNLSRLSFEIDPQGKSKRILFKASRYYPPLLSCKITSRL